jgi:hypothetical protein
MIEIIKECFRSDEILYTKHAKDEMEAEEFGEILEVEVYEAVLDGKTIETYPEDEPYPSCLIFGKTSNGRPLHIVCAYAEDANSVIIITAYQPSPNRWIDFERRPK